MARTLVIKFSSLGDVAITIPLLYSVAEAYPDEEFVFLTKATFQSLFLNKPSNLKIFPAHTKTHHKGLNGILKLIQEMGTVDQVVDLHQTIRSNLISWHYQCKGKKVARMDKGRKGKKALTRKNNKIKEPLKTALQRYQETFQRLGFSNDIRFMPFFSGEKSAKDEFQIGIAPFARHEGKTYPPEKMEKVIDLLSQNDRIHILLFGGKSEREQFEIWAKKFPNTRSLAQLSNFEEELRIMSQLDLMLSMDSANMHLASLTGTPVVSIWGATHPFAGFYPYNQDPSLAIQKEMDCRPCSVFGKKECFRGDWACLNQIQPEAITEKIFTLLEV